MSGRAQRVTFKILIKTTKLAHSQYLPEGFLSITIGLAQALWLSAKMPRLTKCFTSCFKATNLSGGNRHARDQTSTSVDVST